MLVLHWPAQHLPGRSGSPRAKPRPALTASTQAPPGSVLAFQRRKQRRKDAAKHLIQRLRVLTPPDQLCSQTQNSCHIRPFQKPSHLQTPTLQKWDRERHVSMDPCAARSEAAGPAGRGWRCWADTSMPSLHTLLPLAAAATWSDPEQTPGEGTDPAAWLKHRLLCPPCLFRHWVSKGDCY